jgi:hypothetical protein
LEIAKGNWNLTFDFMGKEAGFTNQLRINNLFQYNNNSPAAPAPPTPPPTSVSFNFNNATSGPELLPFSFRVHNTDTHHFYNAFNNGGIHSGLQIAFYQISDTVVYAFLDDGGAGPDADFDDMVIRITAICAPQAAGCDTFPNPTPLPAALPLFAGGLGALSLLGWRRKRKRTAAA